MKKILFSLTVLLYAVSPLIFAGGGSQSAAASQANVELSAPGVLPITKEKVTMDVFIPTHPDKFTDIATNTAILELEEATNVHLNITTAAEGAAEKVNLLLNSGQYPEVIINAGPLGASDLVKYGAVEKIYLPLNDLIEQHAPNIKAFFAKYPSAKQTVTSPDGNLYGIPSVEGSKLVGHGSISYKLWLNTAWLTKLGLKSPTTTEEFRNVLRAFKTRDPNGNGRADEIPLTGATATWAADPWLFLLNAFGYYNENLVMLKNDTFTPVANQDYIRDGLAYIKSLYDEGLIDPAAFTQTMDQMMTVGNNPGTVIMGAATCGHLAMAVDIQDIDRSKAYTALEPLTGPNGYRGIPYSGPGNEPKPTGAALVITDKSKNPALAVKWADAYNTEYWAVRGNVGRKGVDWTDADPGTFGTDGKTPAKFKRLVAYSAGSIGNDILENAFRLLEDNWKDLFQVTGDITDPLNYEARLEQETVKLVPYAADVQIIPPLSYDEDTASRLSQISTPLTDFVKSSFVEFITGRKNLTSDWNTYKQGLEQLGYTEYVRIRQDAYNKIKK
jgi:putative aldouronate transport system substrate-binding protein